MKYTVIIESDAERELYEIADYLETQRTGLADLFMREYFKAVDQPEIFPYSGT